MLMEQVDMADRKVCIGVIAGAHGVRGQVRVKSFTAEPQDVTAYGPVTDASGARQFDLRITGAARGMMLAKIDGVGDRDAADMLRGTELYVDRERLPDPDEDEFYYADLIGLDVVSTDGKALGTVRAMHNFGAGDMIELENGSGKTELLPFTAAVVASVDLAAGVVTIDPPHEIFVRPDAHLDDVDEADDGEDKSGEAGT
jgi:16S rRNA processing protein RimM